MTRFAWAHARGDAKRSIATVLALLLAVSSFSILTASANTQRLEVTQTLERNWRGPYDIVVRPSGTVTGLEERQQLVRAGYLSGIYGGISLEQWRTIKALPGVDVAAPVATLGTLEFEASTMVDVTDAFPPGVDRAVLKYAVRQEWRNGAVSQPQSWGYVYLTRGSFERGGGRGATSFGPKWLMARQHIHASYPPFTLMKPNFLKASSSPRVLRRGSLISSATRGGRRLTGGT